MSKPKTSLKEPDIDNRLLDDRGPTAQRLARTDFEIGDLGTITVRQSPIDRAVKRGVINEQQGRAAEKLYNHWYRAGMAGTIGSADPLKIFGSNNDFTKLCATEGAEFHWRAFSNALKSVRRDMDPAGMGMDAVRLLDLVVCRETPFAEAAQIVWGPGRKAENRATILVRGALRVLVLEWGL
jgi:hypothetical protein